MTSAEQTKQNYERRPYPGTDLDKIVRKGRSIPSLKWMQAIGRPGRPQPQRVLVAGCGTGAEALVMRRRLPRAEIVAIDFSPRSIEIARRYQESKPTPKPIHFLVADLTDPDLAGKTGGGFDLITCHGVLSYIPEPDRVLRGFAALLAPGGALYLGVNGEGHPATRLRPWLAGFGLEVQEMQDERRLRELLGLWDALHDDGIGEMAQMSASYLASDVCGPHFNNWSIARWRQEANQCGWEIAGLVLLPLALRLTVDRENYLPLSLTSVGEMAARLDQARPASFHQIVLRKAASKGLDIVGGQLRKRDLCWTGLYTVRFSKLEDPSKCLAVLSCPTFNLKLEWPLTARQVEAVKELAEAGRVSAGWLRSWGQSKPARRILSIWAGFGILAPSA